jgi:cytolysin-activating lysine-acyltransferase
MNVLSEPKQLNNNSQPEAAVLDKEYEGQRQQLVPEGENLDTPRDENNQLEDEISSKVIQEKVHLLGGISMLMLNSPLHRQYNILDIETRFVPSLIHNQFRYYEIAGRPVGFVNWAWLSDEVEQKFMTAKYELTHDEWKSGDRLWFPEFVAPFGHARYIIKDLRTNVLPKGTPAKSFRINPDGSLDSISKWTV